MKVGILGILSCIFITLQLCGIINWPWWLITLPIWGGIITYSVAFLVLILLISLEITNDKYERKDDDD